MTQEVRGTMSHVDDGTLHAYLDGELPPAERARVEAHVAECSPCRTRLAEERALIERASRLLGLAQPVERPAPPMHQLRRPRLVWRLRVPIAWAASVVLAVGLGYYLGGTSLGRLQPQFAAVPQDSIAPALAYAAEDRQPARVARTPTGPAAEPRAANEESARQQKSADNTRLASGVVAIVPQAALRDATPAPAPAPPPSAAVVTRQGAVDRAEVRGRLVGTDWPIIRMGPARELLGADPVGVPGLTVQNIRRSPSGDVVVVEQSLESTTVIQIFQQRMENDQATRSPERSAVPAAALQFRRAETERLARFIGGVRVEIAGPLSADSLNRLLEQVKPIP